jgi:hypothetical protein
MGKPKNPTEEEAAMLAEIEAQGRREDRFAWTGDEPLHLQIEGEQITSSPAPAGQPQGEVTDANQQPAQVDDVHDGRRPEDRRRRRR